MSITAPLCRMIVFIVGAMVNMEFLVLIQPPHQRSQYLYIHKMYSMGKLSSKSPLVFYHTCVIASNDKDYCWGWGTFGRLGNNGIVQKNAPYPVREFATTVVSQIAAGNEHTCSLNSEGKLYCWGKGINGELGRDVFLGSNTPTAVNMSNFGTESVK